ncbi:unnamed protein product [Prunus armeniaca]|uniref:F-box domain-containing protein n=1 Tax=Prunus armeniaca TaxID=36596 RepID=A0A6J5WLB4_PRUAR|nr:unnamed protein product [Prunus armeniaca]
MQKCQKVGLDSPYRLLYCSSKGDKAGVMHELEKGVKPNLADYDKRTALHLASCEGCTEIVDPLLHKGADVNSTDRWGRTPLSDARSFSHEAICKILEARGGIDPAFHFPNAFTHLLSHSQVHFESLGGQEECGSSNQSIKSPFLRLTGDIRMDQPGVVSEGISQMELSQQSLISGLPDDIALFCLARVPRKYHTLQKCVSKKWRYLVCSEEWHSYCQKHKLDETWIYALCRDKLDRLCCYVLDPNSTHQEGHGSLFMDFRLAS